jgi:TM2 domain-containing membrane protein YozV
MSTPPFPGRPRETTSDKSAVVAGLLQLFFGCFGAGRFYLGSTAIGILQLTVGLFGVLAAIVGFVGLPFLLGAAIWGVLDALLIFTGSVKDEYGRTLRT